MKITHKGYVRRPMLGLNEFYPIKKIPIGHYFKLFRASNEHHRRISETKYLHGYYTSEHTFSKYDFELNVIYLGMTHP